MKDLCFSCGCDLRTYHYTRKLIWPVAEAEGHVDIFERRTVLCWDCEKLRVANELPTKEFSHLDKIWPI